LTDDAPPRSAAELMDVLMWNREPVGGPFALVDHTGTPRTDQDFRGKVLLVYFGLRSVDRVRREQFIKYIELSAVRHLVVEPLRNGAAGRCRRAPGLAEEEALCVNHGIATRTKFNHDPTTNWRESEWRSH
jgi:SCO1/SenC